MWGWGLSKAGGQDIVTKGPCAPTYKSILSLQTPRSHLQSLDMARSGLNSRELTLAALSRMNWEGENREVRALGACGVNSYAIREVKQAEGIEGFKVL